MKLSDYIAEFIAKETKHVFVGNGGCIVHILDSINKNPCIEVIPCENEQGAAIAAEAYSRVNRKLGVAIATSGPGMINLMQGIACAYFDSIPVLYISGAPPISHLKGNRKVRQMGFQEMDVVGIVKPITKYAVLLNDPQRIKYELEKLLYIATEGRPGPVLLDIPDDLQRADINPCELECFVPERQIREVAPEIIDETLCLIRGANRPVVIIGGGVKSGNSEEIVSEFLKISGLPFATTWATIDMFSDNTPNLIGNFGISSNRSGNFAVQNSDLIISLGSRLDTHETGGKPETFAPKARKIIIDIDNAELNKDNGMYIDLKANYDLKEFLMVLNTKPIKTKDLTQWKKRIQDWRERYPVCLPEYYNQKERVNPYVFMNELSRETKEGDIIITDAGATLTWTMQSYKIKSSQLLFSAFNHSPMGYALPASIGAQYAAPDKQVICIIGDGGMQMNIQELETIVYNNLPIKIFMINNGEYGIIKQTQDTWLDSRYVASDPDSGLGFPDFQKIAKAYGMETEEIDNHRELNKIIQKVLEHNSSILCDVKLRHGEKITPKLEFGRPIEDASPLLSREEFKANMLI